MRKMQRVALAAALTAAGLGAVGATANATAIPEHSTQAAMAWRGGGGSVRANERVVEAFLQDVINEHNGGDDWSAILNDTGTYKAPWIP